MEAAGDKLRNYRTTQGLSQEDVALAVGVSFGAISQYERGTTSPRRATAVKLDRYLDAGGELLAAFGYAIPDPTTPANGLNRGQAQLAETVIRSMAKMDARIAALERALAEVRDLIARGTQSNRAGE